METVNDVVRGKKCIKKDLRLKIFIYNPPDEISAISEVYDIKGNIMKDRCKVVFKNLNSVLINESYDSLKKRLGKSYSNIGFKHGDS